MLSDASFHPAAADTAEADAPGTSGAASGLSLELLSEIGGAVELPESPSSFELEASAGAAAGARALVSTDRRALLGRWMGANNIAKPVATPAEVQLVDSLIVKHDALNRDPSAAAHDILEAYTRELLARRGDSACQLRKKARVGACARLRFR